MHRLTGAFDPVHFLAGAESAFGIIVTAFAAGDRAHLQPLLSEDTFRAFEAAITARETAGETQRTEIRAIHAATIEAADLRGNVADITVRFVSDQVNVTLGRDGLPVAGADAVTEITDLWTFERDLTAADPTWRLVAARSA
jgi:predicted lipid-binding transport protein (Tim44 family)